MESKPEDVRTEPTPEVSHTDPAPAPPAAPAKAPSRRNMTTSIISLVAFVPFLAATFNICTSFWRRKNDKSFITGIFGNGCINFCRNTIMSDSWGAFMLALQACWILFYPLEPVHWNMNMYCCILILFDAYWPNKYLFTLHDLKYVVKNKSSCPVAANDFKTVVTALCTIAASLWMIVLSTVCNRFPRLRNAMAPVKRSL